MSTSPAQIDIWRSLACETQNLEFKEASNQYDVRKLCRYCVAIANEGGGHLVLGIADKPPRAVVGSFNGEQVVGRSWPAAEDRVVFLEIHQ